MNGYRNKPAIMNIDKYRKRFITIYFIGKLLMIGFALLLSWADAYTHNQMMDIISMISPTLVASLIIILNYLRSARSRSPNPKDKVMKTELIIVFTSLAFYFIYFILILSTLQTETEAFINMKAKIVFIEAIFGGGVLGWVISDLKSSTKN